jgi:hypothetical protein
MAEKNEFEELSVEDAPEQEFSDVPATNDVISSGAAGIKYDWSTAPDSAKAPPRVDMNGMTVTIKKADIILPPVEKAWDKTRDKSKDVKMCQLLIFYDHQGQQENYSGCRVFKREDGKYSHPSITRDGNNQASALLLAYAKFKAKDPAEVSLRELMGFLNGQPKAKIKVQEVKNPITKEILKKNLIECFV